MVKGVSRQVIVVHAPDPELFEQAIFILKEDAVRDGVTHEMLVREAKQLLHQEQCAKKKGMPFLYILAGAMLTGVFWAVSLLF